MDFIPYCYRERLAAEHLSLEGKVILRNLEAECKKIRRSPEVYQSPTDNFPVLLGRQDMSIPVVALTNDCTFSNPKIQISCPKSFGIAIF